MADEAHNLKNGDAKRWVWFESIYTEKVLFLSGTPITKCASDMYPIFKKAYPDKPELLDLETFREFTSYKRMMYIKTRYSEIERPKYYGAKDPELMSQWVAPLMIRYKKEEVLPELPNKVFQLVELPLKLSREDKKLLVSQLPLLEKVLNGEAKPSSELVQLRTKLAEIKVKPIVDYLSNWVEDNEFGSNVVSHAFTVID